MSNGNRGKRVAKAQQRTQQYNKAKTNKMFRVPERFASINKLITRDLNGRSSSPSFSLYTKDQINTYLQDPYKYQKQLRAAAVYIYGASSHFRRLVQYFVSLTDLSYVVAPYNIDPATAKVDSLNKNYRKVLHAMSAFNVKSQCSTIITTCMREDTYYGTMWETPDNVILQNLPADFCDIATIEDGVFNVTFDFSYFDSRQELLEFYPKEFQTKFNIYTGDRAGSKFQELEAPTSFAIKCNSDILDYSLPPFAGVLREIYDIEDYKQLKLTKTTLENYAMVVMTLGMNQDGEWLMDLPKAKEFWGNLDAVLPEEIGSVLSPMPVEKISFEKANTGNTDTIVEAEQNMFTCAGVSSLLFNNANASSGALTCLSRQTKQSLMAL